MRVTFDVRLFPDPKADKAQALKVIEEAAEAYAAWQDYDASGNAIAARAMLDECADVVQAASNLMAGAASPREIAEAMERCEDRNAVRGRYE